MNESSLNAKNKGQTNLFIGTSLKSQFFPAFFRNFVGQSFIIIVIIAKRDNGWLARVNATGTRNLSLFSKVGPYSFPPPPGLHNLKKKKNKSKWDRHPTGSRSSFPTKKMASERNSVNDLTGFKGRENFGKIGEGGGEGRTSPCDSLALLVVVVGRCPAFGAKHPRREFSYLLVGS